MLKVKGHSIPVIDIEGLRGNRSNFSQVARQIGSACREQGFFYVTNHGVSLELQQKLQQKSAEFFARPLTEKNEISMAEGGIAWRGYFPVGNELTSGKPDLKEGLYFGTELGLDSPLVQAKTPMHGANLFPKGDNEFRDIVLAYLTELTALGHDLMTAFAASLNLDPQFFYERYTHDPLILFRIFNYPPPETKVESSYWGVGEHTDYGFLTILKQDDCGGLEVKVKGQWIDAPPIANTFVCNIGDMLDRISGGQYRSTPHRVRNTAGRNRLSFPLFFDPAFSAKVAVIPGLDPSEISDDRLSRWDQASVHDFEGTYGEYILRKVGKVFPGLGEKHLK